MKKPSKGLRLAHMLGIRAHQMAQVTICRLSNKQFKCTQEMSNGFSCRIIFTNELSLRNRAHESPQMSAPDTHFWGRGVCVCVSYHRREETFQVEHDGGKCLLLEKWCGQRKWPAPPSIIKSISCSRS